MKVFKLLSFCLMAVLLASCAPAFAAPGVAVKTEKPIVTSATTFVVPAHQVIIKLSAQALVYQVAAYQAAINLFADVPALPAAVSRVPKTKVYSLEKYFGMTVISDISHNYRTAKIQFQSNPWTHYLHLPLLIS